MFQTERSTVQSSCMWGGLHLDTKEASNSKQKNEMFSSWRIHKKTCLGELTLYPALFIFKSRSQCWWHECWSEEFLKTSLQTGALYCLYRLTLIRGKVGGICRHPPPPLHEVVNQGFRMHIQNSAWICTPVQSWLRDWVPTSIIV